MPPPESAVAEADGVGLAESSEPPDPSPLHAVSASAPASPTAATATRGRRVRDPRGARAAGGHVCEPSASIALTEASEASEVTASPLPVAGPTGRTTAVS
ncbi:hypothetical protein GCM10010297_59780 [Streptomyces malachitofuscus]|nr:hypothetical protein GCM10010297_59780 [Streptomyces malachitofuscus]